MNSRIYRPRIGLAITAALLAVSSVRAAEPLRVLILSGKNVHDWRTTTPELQHVYEGSGRFKVVEVVNEPATCTAAALAQCDVVVCNWTAHPEMHGHPWGELAEQAVSDFVRGGRGFVAFHAASTAYYDWPEFQQLVGLTWKWQFTSHTAYATFKVAIEDRNHPITRGLSDFWITDELYQNMVTLTNVKPNYQLLCKAFARLDIGGTGQFEPMLIATQLGQGRGLNLLLGHDVLAMRNVGFRTLLLRGTEWAAIGQVTVPMPANWPATAAAAAATGLDADAVLSAVASYRFGQPRLGLFQLEQLVIAAHSTTDEAGAAWRKQLAAKTAALLGTDIAPEAKAFLCKQLALIATEEEVPAVAPLLLDESTSDAALRVLERIPGQAAGNALRRALQQTKGRIRLGVINSLGNRAEAESVEPLDTLLHEADETTVTAAAAALGKVGDEQAAKALEAVWDKTSGRSRQALTDALLACAGKPGESKLRRVQEYAPTRAAALRRVFMAEPAKANDLVAQALAGQDLALRTMALGLIREFPREVQTLPLAAQVAKLPAEPAVLLLIALADREDRAALPAAVQAAIHEEATVRVAALQAIGRLGDAAHVQFLAERALGQFEAEKTAAVQALAVLRGQEVNAAIVRLLEPASAEMKTILIRSLAARGAKEMIAAPIRAVEDANDQVRVSAWQALEELAQEQDLPTLVRLLVRAGSTERLAAEQAVMAVVRQVAPDHKDEIRAAMQQVQAATNPRPILEQIDGVLSKADTPRNMALGAVASSPDGLEPDGGSGNDQAGIDGDPNTYWDEVDNRALYRFKVAFPQPTAVNAINLKGHAYQSHSPKDFDVLCDAIVVRTVRNADYDKVTNELFVGFPRTTCQSLELTISGYYGGSPGIRELEIYDLSAGLTGK